MSSAAFQCSTSQTAFKDKQELADHYKSDLHRYNLKRKVAGTCPLEPPLSNLMLSSCKPADVVC